MCHHSNVPGFVIDVSFAPPHTKYRMIYDILEERKSFPPTILRMLLLPDLLFLFWLLIG